MRISDWSSDVCSSDLITQRVQSAMAGHFGDCAAVGEGVSEMRVHVGPGYRVYFTRVGAVVYLLLAGGDKTRDRKSVVWGKSVSVRVDLGGRRIIKKKIK